jgi:hypothetical protein
MKEIKRYITKRIIENLSKNDINNIKSIDDFIHIINHMEKIPQRGFSFKPNSAIKLPKNTLLFHSTTKENILSILENGFHGVGAYYSSFTKTRKSKEQVIDGNFGFAFDLSNKKVDSRYQKGFLYGSWGIIFKSDESFKVYNTIDKQYQVIFDVNKKIDIVCVVNVKVDNTKEFSWDIYDKNMNLTKTNVKLSTYIKNIEN